VPLPFELGVELSSGKSYVARGAVFAGGLPAWVSDAVAIDPAQGETIDLGTILMTRPSAGAYKSTMHCGDETVVVGFSKTAMLLTVGGETFEMKPVSSASGAKYEAIGDPTTTFWNKGDQTMISVKGRALPECGRGNPAPAQGDPSAAGASSAPGKELEGAEWVVQDLAGKKPIADSRVTLNFSGGTVAGKASCNSYTAQFNVTRQVVTVSQPTSTMMMCEKLMDQEKSFLDILQKTKHYEITPDGALVLRTEDGRTLTAKR
jgi:heat shock protein HslJ